MSAEMLLPVLPRSLGWRQAASGGMSRLFFVVALIERQLLMHVELRAIECNQYSVWEQSTNVYEGCNKIHPRRSLRCGRKAGLDVPADVRLFRLSRVAFVSNVNPLTAARKTAEHG
jgi:hypothetical protein